MTACEKNLVIRTPEGIRFPFVIASPVSRFLALVVDQACIMTAAIVLRGIGGLMGVISADFGYAFAAIAYSVISIGYPMLLEWRFRGQTLGKRLLRLRVMDVQGLKLQPSQVIVRNILRAVDGLPFCYMLGGISCLLNQWGQRIGDLAANTMVIYNPRTVEPDLDQILSEKHNSFRDYPHLVARLRRNISPVAAGIALQALVRRDLFDDAARVALFAEIRRHMEQGARFPAEVIEDISDERYVRNVVDLLFRDESNRPLTP